jgi:hypothetical protein
MGKKNVWEPSRARCKFNKFSLEALTTEESVSNDSQKSTFTIFTPTKDTIVQPVAYVSGIPCPVHVVEHPLAKRISGLVLVEKDLQRALRCIELIPSQVETTIRESLWLSAVGFYARCFVSSEGRGLKLEDTHLQNLPAKLKSVHDKTLIMRHSYTAHAGKNEYEKVIVQAVLSADLANKSLIGLGVASIRQVETDVDELSLFVELIRSVIANVDKLLEKTNTKLKEYLSQKPIDQLYASAVYPTNDISK